LGLASRYGPARLEAACRRAMDVGDPSRRTIKGILTIGSEEAGEEEEAGAETPAFLHGPEALAGAGLGQ
ncbi:MAG: IS21 family transposase, partial [Actinomycetota bacterium]